MTDRADDADWGDAKEITVTGVLATDRADEIARDFYSNLCTRKYMADTIRAYGDERAAEEASKLGFTEDNIDTASVVAQNIRNAALDEAAEWAGGQELGQHFAAGIRALKEKP